MKKYIHLLITILLLPVMVKADGYKVLNHIIDAEVELAGGLNVKELIIIEGNTDIFQRKLNYYSFSGGKWDGETVNLDNGTIYNGYDISISKVSAFKAPENLEINNLTNGITEYFKSFNIKDPSSNTYLGTDNKDGTYDLNIYYDTKNDKTAYYFEYSITNVVVKHNDVKELNYTFKNLNYNSSNTFLRILLPFATKDENFKVYFHGNQSGVRQDITTDDGYMYGAAASFTKVGSSINVRMIIPQESVGIDIYLNKSNIDALDEIEKLEDNRLDDTLKSASINKWTKWVLIGVSILYLLITYFVSKLKVKALDIIYILFGIFISIVNYLFGFNLWYIYLSLLLPIIMYLIRKYLVK